MWENLWLLANQLYWPTTPSVIPALGFGFAVDGGEGIYETCFILGCIPKKYQSRQAGAVIKHAVPHNCDSSGDRNASQAGAVDESVIPDAGNAIRNCDTHQAAAPMKGFLPDGGDTGTNRDARQATAFIEGILPDAGDAIRDIVIGTFLTCRISKQHRLL